MIKNLIFDFGQVLVKFEPYYMAKQYAESVDDAKLVAEVLFDRLYWDRLDDGTISDKEVLRLASERLPDRLRPVAERVYYNWIYNIPPVEGMWELVRRLKASGRYRLLLLSNISEYFAEHEGEIPILSEFDTKIYSARVGAVKPERKIFVVLCERGGIRPEESLFIDDSERNIDGAEKFGIKGYLFDGDAKRLERYIEGL
ncbi:MAG: HAD family phosphatase [Clostridia bacterium]|nr:HAD family phosphatase [Clostridia bacterium]